MTKETLAPIALFTYNRPWHTRQTVEALLKNAEACDSDLIVFSDGAKDEPSKAKVDEVRQYLQTIKGFKSVRIIEREKNFGLAQSIISGVTEVVNEYERVIVLEDDLVTSPYFLKYMNEGLNLYEDDDRVISISGYTYPVRESRPDAYFLKGANCLGWTTWKRGWNLFEPDGAKLLAELTQRDLLGRFDLFGAYNYSGMLRGQINGKNQSWAVRWYASALLKDKLTLYPGKTLVQHIGSDGSGTHCGDDGGMGLFDAPVSESPVRIGDFSVGEDQVMLMGVSRFFKQMKPPLPTRVRNKLQRMMQGLLSRRT